MTSSHRLTGSTRVIAVTAIAALAVALLPLLAGTANAAHFANETQRFDGENRFGTAAQIAQQLVDDAAVETGTDPVDTVLVATGEDFADALAGSTLSGFLNAPILLVATAPDAIPAETVDFLETNPDITNAVILGQEAAVGPLVAQRLATDFGLDVQRIGGGNRFETSADIARYIADNGGEFGVAPAGGEGDPVPTAIVASGQDFPDALAAGVLGYQGTHPIFLTPTAIAEPEAIAALGDLGFEQIVIAGGTQAVSTDSAAGFEAAGYPNLRVSGPTRVDTALEFAEFTRVVLDQPFNFADETGALATGSSFADALTVGPLVASRGGDLVLANTADTFEIDPTSDYVAERCSAYGAASDPFLIAGGSGAISTESEELAYGLLVCDDFVSSGDLFFNLGPDAEGDDILEERFATTVAVGDEVSVATTGFAPAGTPNMVRESQTVGAADAQVTAELYQELVPGTDAETDALLEDIADFLASVGDDEDGDDEPPVNFYVEEEADGTLRVFVEVVATGDEPLVLDENGTATLDLGEVPAEFEGDHRLFLCAPPRELPNPGCTTDEGTVPDTPYGLIWGNIAVGAADPDAVYAVPLGSDQEVDDPGLPGTVPTDEEDFAFGGATFAVYEDTNTLCYGYSVFETDAELAYEGAPGAHIHEGEAGTTGPVVAMLDTPLEGDRAAATCTEIDPADFDVSEITADPGGYYFNLHTVEWQSGFVRGQLPEITL